MKIGDLDALIRAVCPHIDGCNSDGVIWFQPQATAAEIAAAQAVMATNLPNLVTS